MNFKNLLLSQHFAAAASTCKGSSFFSLPTWYEYLTCNSSGSPQLTSISDIWKIVAAVIEILLRVAALVAVGLIIYAGIQYSTSQGNPQQTSKALSTIINAAVGLVICIISAVVVTFIAGSF